MHVYRYAHVCKYTHAYIQTHYIIYVYIHVVRTQTLFKNVGEMWDCINMRNARVLTHVRNISIYAWIHIYLFIHCTFNTCIYVYIHMNIHINYICVLIFALTLYNLFHLGFEPKLERKALDRIVQNFFLAFFCFFASQMK